MHESMLSDVHIGEKVPLHNNGVTTLTIHVIVGHPELEKKSVGIFEYILASMLNVFLDVF